MEKEIKKILVGQGLGLICFGMSREQVMGIVGEPGEKVTEAMEGSSFSSEIWHYDKLDLSLGFDEEEQWKLVSIGISGEFYTFDGAVLIGKKRDEVEAVLENSTLYDLEMDDLADEGETGQCLLVSEENEINFWFEGDVLTEIQWGPLFADDDTIQWPS